MERPDTLDRILSYLDGELAPGEEERLAADLRANPEGRERLLKLARVHARLPEACRLVRGSERIRAAQGNGSPGDGSRLRRRTDRWGLRARREAPSPWNPIVVAAASLAAVLLVAYLAVPRPGRPEPANGGRKAPRPEDSAREIVAKVERAPRRQELKPVEDTPRRVEERQRLEQDLDRVRDAYKPLVERAQAEKGPAAPLEKDAVPPRGEEPPAPRTLSSLASVERVDGDGVALLDGKRRPLKAGDLVLAGEGVEASSGARVALRLPDDTRLELGPDTVVRGLSDKGGKEGFGLWVFVERGTLRAQVSPQPKDRAMGFGTPQAEARVLGTTLRICVDPDAQKGATRLEVTEGKVRLTRLADRASRDVASGHFAVAAVGTALAAKALPVDEVLLVPHPDKAKIVGKNWTLAKDDGANGYVLQTDGHVGAKEGSYLKQRSSYVTFSFWADADKDYHVWVRGWAMSTQDRVRNDAVLLEPGKGAFTRPCPYVGSTSGENAVCFDGFSEHPAYGWISGCVNQEKNEAVPAVVRFARTEVQTLRLYSDEGRMRVSAIWLSTTQKTRPDPKALGLRP